MPRTPDNLDFFHNLDAVASTLKEEMPEDVEQHQAEQHQAEQELNLGAAQPDPAQTSLGKLLEHTDPQQRPEIIEWALRKELHPNDPFLDVHARYAGLLNQIRRYIQQLNCELEDQRAASSGVMHYAQLQHDLAATIKRRTDELRDFDSKLQDSTTKGRTALTEVVDRAAFRGTLKAGAVLFVGQVLLLLVILLFR